MADCLEQHSKLFAYTIRLCLSSFVFTSHKPLCLRFICVCSFVCTWYKPLCFASLMLVIICFHLTHLLCLRLCLYSYVLTWHKFLFCTYHWVNSFSLEEPLYCAYLFVHLSSLDTSCCTALVLVLVRFNLTPWNSYVLIFLKGCVSHAHQTSYFGSAAPSLLQTVYQLRASDSDAQWDNSTFRQNETAWKTTLCVATHLRTSQ